MAEKDKREVGDALGLIETRGLIGMIVAEFFVGLVGLGYLIISYENVFRIDRMFVPVIVVATMGILLMGFVQWIEGRIAPWLKKDQ